MLRSGLIRGERYSVTILICIFMMKKHFHIIVSAACLSMFFTMPVAAQQVLRAEQRAFLPPQSEGIPKVFDAQGFVYKGFSYYPAMRLDILSTSNVYAQQQGEKSDVIYKLSPEISVLKEYKNLQLSSKLRTASKRYSDTKGENRDDVYFNFAANYELNSRWSIPFRYEQSLYSRDRGEPLNQSASREPLRIKQQHIETGISKRFNRLILSLKGGYDSMRFSDGQSLVNGSAIIYRDNDRKTYMGQVGAKYEFLRGVGGDAEHIAFARLKYSENKFARRNFTGAGFTGLSRNGSNIGTFFGLETKYKGLLFANIGVGYFTQDYDEASLDRIGALDFGAEVEYSISPRWMVGLHLDRDITQDNDIVEGQIATQLRLSTEYEVYHRLYLDGEYGYSQRHFDQIGRTDVVGSYSLGALYLLNQNLRAQVKASFTDYQSDVPGSSFKTNSLLFSLIGKL